MSDAAKSRDIDDVLSSIRRLVSEEVSRQQPDPMPETQPDLPAADKLLLTPQLRVTEPEDPYQMIRQLSEEGAAPALEDPSEQSPETDLAEPTIEQLLADLQEAAPVSTPAIDEEEPAQTAPEEEASVLPEANVTPLRASLMQALTLETQEAADLDPPSVLQHRAAANHAEESAPEAEILAPEVETPPETPTEAVAETSPAAETLDADLFVAPEDTGGAAAVEGLLDEEQLRDIIADVVREELAGHLGERITRNVRKLVRREIRQIMASGEFD